MLYRGILTIPAGTPEATPEVERVSLCNGNITNVRVLFPGGPAGLVFLQVWYHERQIYPTTPGESFQGDDHVIDFPDRFSVDEWPFEVELRGWSPDAELDHSVYVSFAVEVLVVRRPEVSVYVSMPEGF